MSILDHLKVIMQSLSYRFPSDSRRQGRDGGEDSSFGHVGWVRGREVEGERRE